MYIEKIDGSSLMIRLSERELSVFESNGDSYHLFEGLLRLAAVKCGFDLSDKCITFKLLRSETSVDIVAEFVSTEHHLYSLTLSSAELLVDILNRFAMQLDADSSCLYIIESSYILTFVLRTPNSALLCALSEYGDVHDETPDRLLRLSEFADAVIPDICLLYSDLR